MDLRTQFLVLMALLVMPLVVHPVPVTTETDDYVAQACTDLVRRDRARLAGFVRVAFHDCVSGCDGCIDPELDGGHNAGLAVYLDALDSAYDGCNMTGRGVSKADFYAKCGQVAAELGRFDSSQDSVPEDLDISFKYGRQDCSVLNGGVGYENPDEFPNPKLGLSHVLQWCLSTFGLSSRECVALMGAHTLGRAHTAASGYTSPWIGGAGERHLDVTYYQDIQNLLWRQHNAAAKGADPRWQWSVGRNGARLMLNTDICLMYDITVDSEGQCTVDNTRRLANTLSDTSAFIEEYSTNNVLWLNEFGQVFTKMIDTIHVGQTEPLVAVDGGAAPIPTEQSPRRHHVFCDIRQIVE